MGRHDDKGEAGTERQAARSAKDNRSLEDEKGKLQEKDVHQRKLLGEVMRASSRAS